MSFHPVSCSAQQHCDWDCQDSNSDCEHCANNVATIGEQIGGFLQPLSTTQEGYVQKVGSIHPNELHAHKA